MPYVLTCPRGHATHTLSVAMYIPASQARQKVAPAREVADASHGAQAVLPDVSVYESGAHGSQ